MKEKDLLNKQSTMLQQFLFTIRGKAKEERGEVREKFVKGERERFVKGERKKNLLNKRSTLL